MSVVIRPANERGHANHGWLDSHHTFSFADYRDPAHVNFGPLRVINEDRVAPGAGFDTHGHRDMEILSYVIDGALEHRDSLGTGSVIRPGEVQVMSAGTGIRHSEFNHSKTGLVHFLQIWVIPERTNITPRYDQKKIGARDNQLRLIASRDGRDDSVLMHQDVDIFATTLEPGHEVVREIAAGRRAWVQVITGEIAANGVVARAGDGLAITDEQRVRIIGKDKSEFLLFDLP